jgi:hypothetical protein
MTPDTFLDAQLWAQQQWGRSDFGDPRRTARAVRLGTALALTPSASLPKQTASWGDLKAAYRLLARADVSHPAVSHQHWQQTQQQARDAADVVLFVQDTSHADFSAHRATSGLGAIGNSRGVGLMMHTTLAIRPAAGGATGLPGSSTAEATVLGVAMQRLWSRQTRTHRGETRSERVLRERESQLWQETLEAIGSPPQSPTGAQRWVSVGDRASDVFSYLETAQRLGWDVLLRVCQNRRIETTDGALGHLASHARSLPSTAQTSVWLRSRNGLPSEQIALELSSDAVWVEPPKLGASAESVALRCWVVRCWGRRSDGTLIEWILLTTIPISDRTTLLEVVRYYEHRWLIEEYHKCLKTGCRIEERQLEQAEALEAFIGFASIVAVRLLVLRTLSREQPTEPAHRHVEPVMIELLRRRLRLTVTTEEMTLRQFWHATARLGGFIGRKSDGDPGWQTLWDGWQQLEQMTWAATQSLPPT